MKPPVLSLIALLVCSTAGNAEELILPYTAFGPPSASHTLIGMDWWQWQPHGESRPRKYAIQVAVYWNQSLAEIQQKFPVEPSRKEDFRYLEYQKAVAHLKKTIVDFRELELSSSELEKSLAALEQAHKESTQKAED